jgi:hypothetical protein
MGLLLPLLHLNGKNTTQLKYTRAWGVLRMRETWEARFKPVASTAAAVAVAAAASTSVQPAAARQGEFSIFSVAQRPQKTARLSGAPEELDELDEYLAAEVPDMVFEQPDKWYKTGLLAGPLTVTFFSFCETSKLESTFYLSSMQL